MSARCEMTELPVDGCAHCRGNNRPAPARPTTSSAWPSSIPARYAGDCAGCGGYYPAGTPIHRGPDGWTADCCPEET